MANRNKNTSRKHNPKVAKKASSDPNLTTKDTKFVWKVSKIDEDGKWGWNKITCPDFLKKIWEKMRNFEKKKWSQILGEDHRKNHMISVSGIVKDARERLKELGHDDQEELVSLRLTGKQRLWAIRLDGEAFLLWWDPDHEICPSPKKHT